MGIGIVAATMLVLALASGQQLPPEMRAWKFFDSFGDEISLAYYGGYVMVQCVPHIGGLCDETVQMELVFSDDGTTVGDGKCNVNQGGALIRLDIDEKTQFGEYRCRYKGEQATSESFKMSYRLCGDRSQACLDTTGCESGGGQICTVSSGAKNPVSCSKLEKGWCEQHQNNPKDWYPVVSTVFPSFCLALSDKQRPLARMNHRPGTTNDILKLSFGDHAVPFNEPFRVTQQKRTAKVSTTFSYFSNMTCVAKTRTGQEIMLGPFRFQYAEDVHLDALLNSSSQIFKLLCTLIGTGDRKAWLSVIIVVLEGRAVATATMDSSGQYTESLHCRVEPAPSEDILVSYSWFRKQGGKIESQANISVFESDEYHCEAMLSYKTCSPFKHVGIAEAYKSENILANVDATRTTKRELTGGPGPAPGPRPSGGTPPSRAKDKWMWLYIGLGGGGGGLLLVTIFVVVCVVLCKKKKSGHGLQTRREMMKIAMMQSALMRSAKSQRTGPPKELLKIATDRKAFNLVQLNEWASNRIRKETSTSKDDEEIQQFGIRARVHEKELAKKGMLVKTEGTRYNNVFTRTDTIVRLAACNNKEMPFNAMLDFHRNKILLGQAPTAKGSGDHWRMMYQEKVGVIVWVGDMKGPDGAEKIFPYAPTEERKQSTVGNFQIVATSVLLNQNGCNTYVLDVNPENDERRQMTLIHIAQWPDHNAPTKPLDLAKAVIHIADQQAKRASQGLTTVLFHCSAGVQRSVATVVCYIGRQMWLAKGTVDPMGILDYVRRHRYAALAMSAEKVNTQLALIGGVLQVICTRATEQMAGRAGTDSIRDEGVFIPMKRKEQLGKETSKLVLLA